MIRKLFIFTLLLLIPSSSFAASDALVEIYEERADLHAAFDHDSFQAIPGTAAGFLIDLEDWARQYGWQSYPELADYAPEVNPPKQGSVGAPEITAVNYIIVDKKTGVILAANNADKVWPIASITKLMTATVALDEGVNMGAIGSIKDIDNVGGARLWVEDGTTFLMGDIFSAMLIGSANNAAKAIARIVGGGTFIEKMNAKAQAMNLSRTKFVDPSGIELGNVSTAREVAYFAMHAFQQDTIRRLTTTSVDWIYAISDGVQKKMKSTNWLLYYPEYDDVYVTSGKTGYLIESGWNLVVRMRPSAWERNKEVLIVTFGSDSRTDSFKDAKALADWVWKSFDWRRGDVRAASL